MNVQEHDKALHAVLTRFQELNLTLRKDKCQFYMPRIEFFGMVFSAQGMSPDPAKVKAIEQADPPTSVSGVRSLLGMTNYVSRFLRNYADIVAPLRDLTHKGVEFKWQEVHQKALHQLKCSLTSDEVMAYFDPHKKTVLFVDTSPVGLGGKVVSYASKALSSVERRYSQFEREELAITWGCHHFRMYLLGSHFKVITHHKPLLHIFNSPTSQASARIDNWRLKLQSFDFEVLYSRGDLNPADYISRHLKANWKQEVYQFLRNYRATPHCTTGIAPATALFGRPIRIKLPCPVAVPCESNLQPALMREHDAHQKLKMKTLSGKLRNGPQFALICSLQK